MKQHAFPLLCAASLILFACKPDEKGTTPNAPQASAEKAIPVKTAAVEERTFEACVRVQGTLEAKNYANVSSRLSGILEEIWVDKGDVVEAGKTKLFVTDRINRERNVQKARQTLAAQEQNLKVAQANVEKVAVELHKAELDKDRYVRLRAIGAATPNELELYTTQFEQAKAGLKYAKATEAAAAEQVKGAQISLAIQEKDLSDCLVFAPISGVVSQRMREPGEMGTSGGVVLRIEDISTLEAVAFIPGQYYDQITVGETSLRISVNGKPAGSFKLTYKSPVIDPALRTFEIKAVLPGKSDAGIVPGAMADIVIVLVTRKALAVPTHSVLEKQQGMVLFTCQGNRAKLRTISCGLQNDGWTELLTQPDDSNPLKPGDIIIAEGQYLVSDNGLVNIQE